MQSWTWCGQSVNNTSISRKYTRILHQSFGHWPWNGDGSTSETDGHWCWSVSLAESLWLFLLDEKLTAKLLSDYGPARPTDLHLFFWQHLWYNLVIRGFLSWYMVWIVFIISGNDRGAFIRCYISWWQSFDIGWQKIYWARWERELQCLRL